MSSFTNEFKVGLLTILAAVFMTLLVLRIDDRPDGAIEGYELFAWFPSAEGLYPSTQVVMAGVSVGSVREIELDGERAKVRLEMSGQVELPTDSTAELRASGILGDKLIRIVPGTGDELLADRDEIQVRVSGPDIDALTDQVEQITEDVQAITGEIRGLLEDEAIKDGFLATVDNIQALSEDIRSLSASNRAEVDAIAKNLREVSETLNSVLSQTSSGLEGDLGTVRDALEKLDSTMARVESIASKVDEGEGTLGALINDDEPIVQLRQTFDEVNASLQEVSDLVSTVSRLQTRVEYHGNYFVGSDPSAPGFDGNPVAGQARNTLSLLLVPQEDYWYEISLVDHPVGVIDYVENYNPDLGTFYAEYTRTRDLRVSFQFARRIQDTVFRLGLKESAGGVGLDQYLIRDRLKLSADLYDFTNGSWPVHDGTPNLALGLRAEPVRHVFIEAGLDNTLLGLRYDYYTAWFGGGFHFTDNDVKWLLSTIPVPQ